jgi:aspartate carbamoyltransferase catalytic subunit
MTPTETKLRRPLPTPPVAASPFPYHPGSLLSVMDLSLDGLSQILARATALENQDPLTRARILAKRRIALLFYESSTRTRTSFELAAKGLGADTTLVSSLSSSIEKGETLKDTGLTLRALGAEAIILRHPNSGAAWLLEAETRLPVLNGGDGMHQHPTQALLDLRTMLAHFDPVSKTCHPEHNNHSVILSDRSEPGSPATGLCRGGGEAKGVEGPAVPAEPIHHVTAETLAGVTVAITGDILHSRVARSNMLLLPRLGARVLLCGPKALLPDVAAQAGPGIEVVRDFEAALTQSQVVMMLRIQAERLAGLQLDLDEYKTAYQLTGQRLAAFAPKAIVLHPGPIIRGLEITAGVADGPQSVILEQVRHGVAIRMAVVERALTAKA